jgi:dephospho-CoA kinase
MNKKIIALAAPVGAGKSSVANYILGNYHGESYRYSDTLAEILKILNLEKNRQNLQDLSQALREKFGQDILEKSLLNKIKNSSTELLIIDGVRRKEDIGHIKNEPGFYLIFIDAPLEVRAERLQKRREKTDDQKVNKNILNLEEKHNSETREKELKEIANFQIDNGGTLEDLERQIKEIMGKIM